MKFIGKLIVIFTGHAILLAIFGPIALSVATGVVLANMLMAMGNVEEHKPKTGVTVSAPTSAYIAPELIEIKPNQFKIG